MTLNLEVPDSGHEDGVYEGGLGGYFYVCLVTLGVKQEWTSGRWFILHRNVNRLFRGFSH